jgi:hypothetical protein
MPCTDEWEYTNNRNGFWVQTAHAPQAKPSCSYSKAGGEGLALTYTPVATDPALAHTSSCFSVASAEAQEHLHQIIHIGALWQWATNVQLDNVHHNFSLV